LTDSDTPLCSDQLKENIAAHTKAEAARAAFLVCVISFLHWNIYITQGTSNSGVFQHWLSAEYQMPYRAKDTPPISRRGLFRI
jgi:hypothetical protein